MRPDRGRIVPAQAAAAVLGGLLVAGLAIGIIARGLQGYAPDAANFLLFFLIWALAGFAAVQAPGPGKAWRRMLIAAGCLCLLWPLASYYPFVGSEMPGEDREGVTARMPAGMLAVSSWLALGLVLLAAGWHCGRRDGGRVDQRTLAERVRKGS
ncbi:hypothetical protein PC39_11964 [Salinisphaera sp. PC39]|uniref:hypothetical protein n=1 Tax=Salinisphaera sp. PC39 TaxID=1304156 RepID=UPI003340105F